MIDHLAQFLHTLFIGGNLGTQIGDVLIRVTGRVFRPFQKVGQARLIKFALIDQFEVVNQDPFFFKNARIWCHRSRRNPADIGMVPTRCDIEQDILAIIAKHRGDQGDVGQMRAAVIRIIEHINIASFHAADIVAHDRLNRFPHRSQMDRHMRRIGNQKAFLIKQRTGEIKTFLDVDRV